MRWFLKWFRAQYAIGHISLCLIVSMILTCVLTIPCLLTSSPMINWLRGRPISSVHLLLNSTWTATQRWESCVLVAEVRWRRLALRCLVHVTRASWQVVLDSWPRCDRELHVFNTASRPILCCRGGSLAGNTVYVDQSVPQRGRRRGSSASGSVEDETVVHRIQLL